MDYVFNKKVNVGTLHKELVSAGFEIDGVTWDEGTNNVIVHFAATTKDVIDEKKLQGIIDAHVYIEDVIPDFRSDLATAINNCKAAKTVDEKLLAVMNALIILGKQQGIE